MMLRWIDWGFLFAAVGLYAVADALILYVGRKRRTQPIRPWHEAGKLALAAYAAALIPLLVWPQFSVETFGRGGYVAYNIVPFRSLVEYIGLLKNHQIGMGVVLLNLVGNIIIFVPLGLLAPAVWPKFRRFWRCLALGALASLGVELAQLLFSALGMMYRTADIDDVLLNSAGAAVGYCAYALFSRVPRWFGHERRITDG